MNLRGAWTGSGPALLAYLILSVGCVPRDEAKLPRAVSTPQTTSPEAPAPIDAPSPPDMKVRPSATIRVDGVRDLTFDDLEIKIARDGDFQESMLTDAIRELEGKEVVLRGFMLGASVFQQTGITQFVLIRDNQECCFGPGAYIYHNVQVEMTPGVTANFTSRPITLTGTFHIRPFRVGEKCYSIYHIAARSAR